MNSIKAVMLFLLQGDSLHASFRDHLLHGEYKGRRECHLEPNWLLIYQRFEDAIIFERTGTHSDLFE